MAGPYNADSIEVLTATQAIRKRPAMYVGGTRDGSGLHELIWQPVRGAIGLHHDGRGTRIGVQLVDGWVTLSGDGGSLTADSLTRAVTEDRYMQRARSMRRTRRSNLPDGNWLVVISALSERCEVTTGNCKFVSEHGVAIGSIESVAPEVGTTVRFRPDPEVFGTLAMDPVHIATRLQELAWLVPTLHVSWQGQQLDDRGIVGWSRQGACEAAIAASRRGGGDVDVEIDIAIGWRSSGAPMVTTFVNLVETFRGPLVDTFWPTIESACRSLGHRTGDIRTRLEPGVIAIVDIRTDADLEFRGGMGQEVRNPELGVAVELLLRDMFANPTDELRRFLIARLV